MKKFLAILTLAAVLAVSGCNGSTDTNSTSASNSAAESSGGKETLVAYAREDTTDDALDFIKDRSPLFYDYLQKRMRAPLSMVTCNTIDGKDLTYGIYIKDGTHAAVFSDNVDGTKTTVIYDGDKAYQVDTGEKAVYVVDYGEDEIKRIVERFLIRIDYSEASNSIYNSGIENVDGKDYNYEAVEFDGNTSYFYFENGTNELRYLRSGDVLTKVTEFKNEVTETDVFVVPSDYERRTFEDLMNKDN